MTSPEMQGNYQVLADDMAVVLHERLAETTPVEVFSTGDNKVLQLVEAPNGERIVTRSYSREAVDYIERRGLDFTEAWEGMHDVFRGAGIDVLPSYLLRQEGDTPFVVVSEYLDSAMDIRDAPTEAKEELASKIGGLLKDENLYLPALEMLSIEMFKATQQADGTTKIQLIDVDPYMIGNPTLGRDQFLAEYVKRFSRLFWDSWCTEEERPAVIKSLVMSVVDVLGDRIDDMNNPAAQAFMDMHLMSNGVDPAQFGLGVPR